MGLNIRNAVAMEDWDFQQDLPLSGQYVENVP
jgi:hypothetical protein